MHILQHGVCARVHTVKYSPHWSASYLCTDCTLQSRMCDYHVPQNQGRRKHRTMTFVSSHLDFAAVNTCWQDGAQLRLTTRGGSWSCGYSAGRARTCHSVALSPLIFSAIVWWCAYIVHCIANCDVYKVLLLSKQCSEHKVQLVLLCWSTNHTF